MQLNPTHSAERRHFLQSMLRPCLQCMLRVFTNVVFLLYSVQWRGIGVIV
jgi:hypothetical protein